MSEADIDPHHGIPLETTIDDPLDGVSEPPSSSLSPQDMQSPDVDHHHVTRRPTGGATSNARYKSWKKKFNKMRVGFRDVMSTSNELFKEEYKLERIARRIQEQNDQLLEILLDVNGLKRLNPSLRYDLRSPTPSEAAVPALEPDDGDASTASRAYSLSTARKMLAEAQSALAEGNLTTGDHAALLARIRAGVGPARYLALLEAVPHSDLATAAPTGLPDELRDEALLGYLTSAQEDEYLAALDAGIDPAALAPGPKDKGVVEHGNASSTYRWLRRHYPAMWSDDEGGGGGEGADGAAAEAKAAGSPPPVPVKREPGTPRKESARAKRPSAAAAKPEEDKQLLDDFGMLIGEAPPDAGRGSVRGKRKREDEPYRPKGGSGSRARRKASEGGGRPASAKKGAAAES